jgi:hypothetical protein
MNDENARSIVTIYQANTKKTRLMVSELHIKNFLEVCFNTHPLTLKSALFGLKIKTQIILSIIFWTLKKPIYIRRILYFSQCCGAGAARSRNFWPELEPVFEVSAPGQTEVVYFIIIHVGTGSGKWPRLVFFPKNHEKLCRQAPTSWSQRRLRSWNFLKVGAGAGAKQIVSALQHWFLDISHLVIFTL